MRPSQVLAPVFVLVALTFVVWLRMYVVRIRQMRRDRIHPQAVATSAQAGARLTESAAADNFRNLFELPVLFYLAVTIALVQDWASPAFVVLSWAFVLARAAHSAIHCGYNRVMHRFVVYVSGAVALWCLWAVLLWAMLAR